MNRLSKGLYIGGYAVGNVVAIIFVIIAVLVMIEAEQNNDEATMIAGLAFMMIGGAVAVLTMLLILILTHKMWTAIQDGHARTTPGKAVGFLFIPLYNLYWVFQVLPGFAEDYNKFIERNSIQVPPAQVGVFNGYAIFILVSFFLGFVPFLNWVVMFAGFIFALVVINHVVDALNALYGAAHAYRPQ